MFLIVVYKHVRKTLLWKFTFIDGLILWYIVSLLVVSIFTTGIRGILFGGRYDFEFLLAFWTLYHGYPLLQKPFSYYIKLFLLSGGIMIFLSWLLKWPLTEDILLYFWYCGNPSNWQACDGVPPIFHGVDGANIRRFQGLLDGPNSMWAFLILYSWVFLSYMRHKKDWYFVTGMMLLVFFVMIIYTYSRSALLGILGFYALLGILSMRTLYRKYKKNILLLSLVGVVIVGILWLKFSWSANAIIGRAGSTKGHFERMITSIDRFRDHPFGQGLASSGPAYRYVQNVKPEEMEEKDRFYIPESWFIQQFVEWGFVSWILFIVLMGALFFALFKENIILAAAFAGVTSMNFFLHTFESTVVALPLFLLIGGMLSKKSLHDQK